MLVHAIRRTIGKNSEKIHREWTLKSLFEDSKYKNTVENFEFQWFFQNILSILFLNSFQPTIFEAIAIKNNFMFVSMDDFWAF